MALGAIKSVIKAFDSVVLLATAYEVMEKTLGND